MTHPNSLKNLKPFVKGQTGYPYGGKRLPADLQAIKSLSYHEVVKLISKWARMTDSEMDLAMKDPDTIMLELCFGSIFKKCKEFGDFTRVNFLLDRCIGKPREIADDDESDEARSELEKLSIKELLTLVKNNLPEELNEITLLPSG